MKAPILFMISVLVIAIDCLAQGVVMEQYFTIEKITSEVGGGDYAIPLVKSDISPEAAYKINQVIQLVIIRKSYSIVGEAMFDDMLNDKGYGTEMLDYTVLLNSPAILSLQFNDQTIASYPDYHTYYLNFNSATGDIIDLPELLNKQGLDHLNDLAGRELKPGILKY